MNATPELSQIAPFRGRLEHAFDHFERALEARLRAHVRAAVPEGQRSAPPESPPPDDLTPYGRFVREHDLDTESQLLVMLALAPSLRPDFFDRILQQVLPGAGEYPQFGGLRGRQHREFIPTGDTALFLLAGDDLDARARWQTLLCGDHPLVQKGIVYLEEPVEGDPPMSGRLVLDSDYAERFVSGKVRAPRLSMRFPAQRLDSALGWNDVVLPPRTLAEIRELENWIRHGDVLMHQWGMRHKLRPGCRALFFGPPGTGKTLTATVLGKATGRQVYKVDLSMVVSKYIGETEKNLAGLFDRAEHKDWILFFDEADALFGKRTQVRDAHDRYANQEVSFLLQRIETCHGLVDSRVQPRESCRRSIRAPLRAPRPLPDAPPERTPDDLEERASGFSFTGAGDRPCADRRALRAERWHDHECDPLRIVAGDLARRDRFTAARSTGRDSPRVRKGEQVGIEERPRITGRAPGGIVRAKAGLGQPARGAKPNFLAL